MKSTPTNISPAKAQRRKVRIGVLSLRLCAFAGALLLAFTVAAQTLPSAPGGIAELKKGDYDNAFKLLTARLASTPNDIAAQKALLRVFLETGRYAEAEASAKKFLTKTPDAGTVRHELAETLATTGRYTEAIA